MQNRLPRTITTSTLGFFALGVLAITSCSRPQALFQRTPPVQYAGSLVRSAQPTVPPPVLEASANEGKIPTAQPDLLITHPDTQTARPSQRSRQTTRPKLSDTKPKSERLETVTAETQQTPGAAFYEPTNAPLKTDKVILPAGAQITAQLIQPVNSAYVQPGQLIPVRIINDVTVKRVKLIKGGAAGMATVLAVDRSKKPFVSIALTSVQAVDGQQVPVSSGQIRVEGRKGGTATGGWIGFGIFSAFGLLAVIGGAVSGGLLFIALGTLFGLIKKPAIPAEINVGTTLSGTTASEVEIDID